MDKNIQNLKFGDHISCIYRDGDELFSLVIPFFVDGLKKHNKCIFVYSEFSPEVIIEKFGYSGFDLTPYIETNEFVIAPKDNVYLTNGFFSADDVINHFSKIQSDALSEGFAALRVAGDSSWINGNSELVSEFMKYESRVNDYIQGTSIVALCLYPESAHDHNTLVDAISNHPGLYLYDKFTPNEYFGSRDNSGLTYEQMVNNLYNKK